MYRFLFRPKWIGFHLLCIFGIVLMVNLAFWQLSRLDQRQNFNSEVRQRSVLEIVDLAILPTNDPSSLEWRAAGVFGTYLPEDQVLIINRSQGGLAGMNLVTPLLLDDGRAVLINRGFIPLTAEPPAAPAGRVQIVGTLHTTEIRSTGQATEGSGALSEFFRIDIDRIQQQIEPVLLPVFLAAEKSKPNDDSLLAPIAAPVLSEGPHLSYAVQWFIFATAVLVGWVLAVRKSLSSRLQGATVARTT